MELSPSKLLAVHRRTDLHCAYCGMELGPSSWTVDHIVPTKAGGDNSVDNLVLACRSCNSVKTGLNFLDNPDRATFRFRMAHRKSDLCEVISPSQHMALIGMGKLPPLPYFRFWFEEQGIQIVAGCDPCREDQLNLRGRNEE